MASYPMPQPSGLGVPDPSNFNVRYHSWLSTFREVMTGGMTPLWIAAICALATVAVIAAALNSPVNMGSNTTGSSAPGGAASTAGADTTAQQNGANNQEGISVQAQSHSSQTNTSVQANDQGTTVTVNGQTETIPAGQSVDRTMTYDQDGTHTEVHISTQSSVTDDGNGPSHQINLNVQSHSTSEGGTQQ